MLQLSEPARRYGTPAIHAGHELAKGLDHLKNLEKFSIDSRCFKPSDQNDESLSLALYQLTKSCASTINEIEIGILTVWPSSRSVIINHYTGTQYIYFYNRPDRKGHVCQISSSALEAISNCFNLERLTLANLEVDPNHSFLPSVIQFSIIDTLLLLS